jgi:hypothetical protein
MITTNIRDLREASRSKPAGYLEACLEEACVVGGEWLLFTEWSFWSLLCRYDPPTARLYLASNSFMIVTTMPGRGQVVRWLRTMKEQLAELGKAVVEDAMRRGSTQCGCELAKLAARYRLKLARYVEEVCHA